MKIKYLPAFFVNGLFMARRTKWAGTARIMVWRAMLGPSIRHVHDANGPRAGPAWLDLQDCQTVWSLWSTQFSPCIWFSFQRRMIIESS
jgi:hypothetical protein